LRLCQSTRARENSAAASNDRSLNANRRPTQRREFLRRPLIGAGVRLSISDGDGHRSLRRSRFGVPSISDRNIVTPSPSCCPVWSKTGGKCVVNRKTPKKIFRRREGS
jgi:hypothetical protein